ncbi:sensor of ECF-type sigma factor [Namhaeicola litoreus]|uniref:Sensor of ECF-type sigma factor n=1 Tax=Namhaeicola litoreus TaxID=1052145 RepID=A0ABW3Y453_9FLAO
MKISILTLFIVLLLPLTVISQENKHEKLKAFKTAYLTEQLNLTKSEAEKFWPIYNKYEDKTHAVKIQSYKTVKKAINEKGGFDSITEKEAESYLKSLMDNEEKMISLKMNLYNDLKPVLSSKKILQLHHAEHEFNRRLLDEYKRKQANAGSSKIK